MAFTEFYCNASTGDNLNGGSSEGSPTATDAAATYGRDTGAGALDRITASSGTPFSAVSVGQFVGVKAAGGTGAADFVCRVTAVNDSGASIDVSDAAASGTRPANDASVDVKVGGAWKGPNAAVGFPFNFVTLALTDANTNRPRVNFKNNATYSITAAISHGQAGPTIFQGYTTTVGDGGKFIIDASGLTGSSITMLTISQPRNTLRDAIFQNNGDTTAGTGINLTASGYLVERVVARNIRGHGFASTGSGLFVECEAYSCNQSNTASLGGISVGGRGRALRCISHNNNQVGFLAGNAGGGFLISCIADSNTAEGMRLDAELAGAIGCVAYNNGGSGITTGSNSATQFISNCILAENGGYGIASSSAILGAAAFIQNCAFYDNTSGEIQTANIPSELITGSITLTGDPFTDAANGNFTINNTAGAGAACRNTGYGTFMQIADSYTGTVSYPDVGAVQHLESPTPPPAQIMRRSDGKSFY